MRALGGCPPFSIGDVLPEASLLRIGLCRRRSCKGVDQYLRLIDFVRSFWPNGITERGLMRFTTGV